MNLFLIRHGIAVDRGLYAQDEARPLTDKGQRRTQAVAHRLHQLGLTFDLILSSPLVRAQQTAAILHQASLSPRLGLSNDLAPEGRLEDWLGWLAQWRQDQKAQNQGSPSLAIVGHEPNLGEWASQLLWGSRPGPSGLSGERVEGGDRLTLKKAGLIGLRLPQHFVEGSGESSGENPGESLLAPSPLGRSQLFWLTPPRYLL
ncbi:MAG: phosphohistidine phosphatase SixA [Synechococcales cyanobacterium CRU_2_2]|nr:phosphohistidine phosphatase SixA [Synechococcales cyanobacterium CRU_2_2]